MNPQENKMIFRTICMLVTLAAIMRHAKAISDQEFHDCVEQFVKDAEEELPEVALEAELYLIELNPLLRDLSLTQMLQQEDVNTNLSEAGHMGDEFRMECGFFVDHVKKVLIESQCRSELFKMNSIWSPNYQENVRNYPRLDKIIGYESVCSLIY